MRRDLPALTGRYLLIQAYGVIAFMLVTLALAFSARAAEDASAFVERLGDEATLVLSDDSLTRGDRRLAIEGMLQDYFDVALIGRLVLGRHWRAASSDERRNFLELFEAFVLATYARRLEAYAGETLEVGQARDRGRQGVLVPSRLNQPAGEPIAVIWRLRRDGGSFRVVDIVVEGVSMVITQRTEFDSVIRRGDGGIDALLENLRSVLARQQSRSTAELLVSRRG